MIRETRSEARVGSDIHTAVRQPAAARRLLFDANMETFFLLVVMVFALGACGVAVVASLVNRARAIAVLRDRVTSLEYAVFELRGMIASRSEPAPHPFRTAAPIVPSDVPLPVRPSPVASPERAVEPAHPPAAAARQPIAEARVQHPAHGPHLERAAAPMRAASELRLSDAAEEIAPAGSGFGTWERFLGVRAAAALGAIVLVVAGVFFVRFSIAEGVLTPLVRVLLGGALGGATWIASETVLRKKYPVLASWLGGAAVAILYLVVWASAELYALVPAWLGFAGMTAITACATVLAIVRRSGPIAVLGCLGGFATPVVLGASSTPVIVLFLYLLILDVAFLAVARYRESAVVALVSAVATVLYVGSRLVTHDFDLPRDTAITAVFGALFALAPIGSSAMAKATRWIGLFLPLFFATGLVFSGADPSFVAAGVLALVSLAAVRFRRDVPWLATLVALAALGLAGLFGLRAAMAAAPVAIAMFAAATLALAPSSHRAIVALAVPWALLPAALRLAWAGDALALVPAIGVALVSAFVAVRAVRRPTQGAILRTNAISAAIVLTVLTIVAREGSASLGTELATVTLLTALGLAGIAFARDRVFASAAILFGAIAFTSSVASSSIGYAEVGMGLVYAMLVAIGGALTDKTHYRALAMLLVTCGAARWLAGLEGDDAATFGLRALACGAVLFVAIAAASSYAFGPRTRASTVLGAIVSPIAIAPLALAFPHSPEPIVGGALAIELALFALALVRRGDHTKLAAHLTFGSSVALATVLAHLVTSGVALTVVHVAIGTGLFVLARRTTHAALATLGFSFFGWSALRITERAIGGELATLAVETSFVAAGAAIATLATERPLTRALLLISTIAAIGAALYLGVGAFFEPSAPIAELFSRLPARDVTHSLVFAVFGGVLLALGLWHKSMPLRAASLAVVLATLAKVFLFDVGRLDDLARVASLTALALSLIAISFVYQRFVFRRVHARA